MNCLRFLIRLLTILASMAPALLGAAPPINDAFGFPTVLSGFPASVSGTNVDATLEPGEPTPDGWMDSSEASVWFRWTSPTNGSVQIDTLGSDFDTILAVWEGSALDQLTLACGKRPIRR